MSTLTKYPVSTMIRNVRAILEENINSVPLEGVTDVGTISINEVIKSVLTKAVDSVYRVAPMEIILKPNVDTIQSSSITAIGTSGGSFSKPDKYLRTLTITNNAWDRAVMELTPLSSPYVSIARSAINLSVGNKEKPLAVDSFDSNGSAIEIYPYASANTVMHVYVKMSDIATEEGVEKITCDDGIYHAACLFAAYLVAMIKNYSNAAAYQTAALNLITVQNRAANATSGAPVAAQ